MKIGVYAGSFDPFTNGHLHVVRQAHCLFDKVYVVMATNSDKKRRIDADLMLEAIKKSVSHLDGTVEVVKYDGLIADFAAEVNADFLIRGIRNGMDYEYEESLAQINNELGIGTIYVRAGIFGNISSSMVMELHKYGKPVHRYVPLVVNDILK